MARAFEKISTVLAATVAARVQNNLRAADGVYVRTPITARIRNHAESLLLSTEQAYELIADFIATAEAHYQGNGDFLSFLRERDGILGMPEEARHDRAKLAYVVGVWEESLFRRAVA